MKDIIRMEIDMEQKMCSLCKKSGSDYYELKTQIRFLHYDDVNEMKRKIVDLMFSSIKGINKAVETDRGVDFYLASHSNMNKVKSLFHGTYLYVEKKSKKLMGRDQLVSKDLYRYFQSITLVGLRKGDIIVFKGEEFSIKGIMKNELVLLSVNDLSKKTITYEIAEDYIQLISRSE